MHECVHTNMYNIHTWGTKVYTLVKTHLCFMFIYNSFCWFVFLTVFLPTNNGVGWDGNKSYKVVLDLGWVGDITWMTQSLQTCIPIHVCTILNFYLVVSVVQTTVLQRPKPNTAQLQHPLHWFGRLWQELNFGCAE